MAYFIHNYNFRACIGQAQIGFMKVSGIERTIETFTYAEGGLNDLVHVFPNRVKNAGTLHFESGFVQGNLSPFLHVGVGFDTMRIEVLNTARKPVRYYTFKNLVVTKWELGELDAKQSEILVERFEVTYGEVYVGT